MVSKPIEREEISQEERELRQGVIELAKVLDADPNAKISGDVRETTYAVALHGCFHGWYPTTDRNKTFKQFWHKYLHQILENRGWNVSNIAYNMNAPNSLNNLKDGWLRTDEKHTLSNSDDWAATNPNKDIIRYTKLLFMEIDYATGKIEIGCEKYDPNKPENPCLFTSVDLAELLRMGEMQGGPMLSMERVSNQNPFHPFWKISFWPSYMNTSRLMRCMFVCDYLLKSMATGAEAQFMPDAQHDRMFEVKSMEDGLMKHMPGNLKQLIRDFGKNWTSGRVWFEAARTQILKCDGADPNKETYSFGKGQIIVRYQKTKLDGNGKSIDVKENPDKWTCLVLDEETSCLMHGKLKVSNHCPFKNAFVVVPSEQQYSCIFYDSFDPEESVNEQTCLAKFDVDAKNKLVPLLSVLCQLDKDEYGRINTEPFQSKSAQTDDQEDRRNMAIRIVSKVVRLACDQVGLEHGYSPIFCSVHDLTNAYDQLEQYVPEFGRLRELSKIVSLSKLLASKQRELEQDSQTSQSSLSLLKRLVTSTPELKRLNAFNKALKDLQYGSLEDKNYSTDEQMEKAGACFWVPAIMNPEMKAYATNINNMPIPDRIFGGISMERKAEIMNQSRRDGTRAENYHFDVLMDRKNPNLFVVPQLYVPAQRDLSLPHNEGKSKIIMRYADYWTFDSETGKVVLNETKSGNAPYNRSQREADAWNAKNKMMPTELTRYEDRELYAHYSTKKIPQLRHYYDGDKYILLPYSCKGLQPVKPYRNSDSYLRLPAGNVNQHI